jgi:type IV pilus assembly protein PilW
MVSRGVEGMKGDKGFTLTELMVSLVISGVLMTGVYSVFNSQQKSYAVQDQLAGAHQNLRAAMNLMVKDIRMAGFDPLRDPNAGINQAERNKILFTMRLDSNHDGIVDVNDELKSIEYSLIDSPTDSDDTIDDLVRNSGAGRQPIAQNIDALDVVYLDEAGKPLEFPIVNFRDIRAVQITLVARAEKPDAAFKNDKDYFNQQGDVILPAKHDGYRRKRLSEQVNCRNLAF